MIEVAVILSGIVRHWPDFFIFLLLLFANALIGFWEERQAGNAIDAPKAKLAATARVKRDGKGTAPPARELVPGDAIRLRLGDIVPADARLLAGDAVFPGSIVRRGEVGALVYATGGETYLGKTAELVQTTVTVSHFQNALLTVAAIPVAMPTVLSATMAVGAHLLAKKQAIVSKLVAIEKLAGLDMLCADKTATLK